MDLISIIVPIYKVEAYLDTCVQSIVDQTYTNLEIILVDDGSPDNCGAMCDVWAKKDDRIKVVHKENGGLSDARNAGMAVATGTYIGFVDSDDYIHATMYETLYAAMKENGAQIAECDRANFSDDQPPVVFDEIGASDAYTAEKALAELIVDGVFRQTVWNKLYTREVIGDVLFPVGKTNEDEFWTYRVFGAANTVVHVTAPLYFYYQRSDSIIHTYNAKRLHCLEALKQRDVYVREHYPALIPVSTLRRAWTCLYHYQCLARCRDVDADGALRKMVHAQFCAIDRRVAKPMMSLKDRVWMSLFRLMPNLTVGVRNRLKIGV